MHSLITLYKECHVTISRKFSDVALVFSRLLALLSCVPLAAQDEQEKLIEKAKKYDLDTWRRKIAECNDKLYKNLTDQESGWQLLTGYDFLTVGSCDITTRQYPFFESFLEHFVLKDIKEMEDEHEDEMKESDNLWYLEFKKSWTLKPEWWSRNHDIVLIQLALKHGDDWKAYRKELTGEKASDFMMRLSVRPQPPDDDGTFSVGTDLDDESVERFRKTSTLFIPGQNLRMSRDFAGMKMDSLLSGAEEVTDTLKPFLEFQHWCRHESNILHRLKYGATLFVPKSLIFWITFARNILCSDT